MTEEKKQENRLRIGGQVAAIRKKKGLSIRELAEACGVTAQNITKIEHGKYNVSIDILGKICEALGYHVDIKPNMGEVIVTKEEIEELRKKREIEEKSFVIVKGSSLDEALKERMSRK
jgi:transcriptional regulator with XRE-family HTH domain